MLICISLLPVTPSSMGAQGIPPNKLLLVHGFGSDGNGWAPLELLLEQSIPNAQAYRPNLTNYNGFEVMASELAAILGASDTMGVAIAHSAGGVASRVLDRQTNGRLRGVLTVGSPLRGAAIAKNSAVALATFGAMISEIMYPVDVYFENPLEPWSATGLALAGYLAFVNGQIPALTSLTAQQLAKGSSYMNTLNSTSNLQREVASGLKRLAIVNETSPENQLCRNTEFWSNCAYVQYALEGLYLAAESHYANLQCDYGDDVCQWRVINAGLWGNAAGVMYLSDFAWCGFIEADIVPGGCRADGLIAANAQSWPDAPPAHHNLNGPNHMFEKTDSWVKNRFRDLLLENFNWPSPPPPPPPPPSVEILGQTAIAAGVVCTWSAYVTGAEGSLTYAWSVDGQSKGGNSPQLSYGSPNPPFEIQVIVTAQNGTFGNSLYVDYDPGGWCQ
jgi:hypothetical protein